eukprot:scaffold33067_cov72-Phaeocystis_antarctica.AAC.1
MQCLKIRTGLVCATLSATATSSFGPVIAVPSLDPALLVAAEHPVYHSINARVPSVPHGRVPLRARDVPTNSCRFRPRLL